MKSKETVRIGIDVGGTFTDAVLLDAESGQIFSVKVPTTPNEPITGTLHAIRKVLAAGDAAGTEVGFIGHGTTTATNMIIEGAGARTALLTTKGFRDILEIRRTARHDRADLYDLFFTNPQPLVARRHRIEVDERILFDGTVERELDDDEIREHLKVLRANNVEAVAVCFINSHVNPDHERRAVKLLRAEAPDLFVTGSFECNPEMLEYERTSTTVINAMLGPKCGAYIETSERRLKEDVGLDEGMYFMQSNGGLARPRLVARRPVALLESGPAGGVSAAVRLCEKLQIPNAIAGDMGGTSFDVSIVRDYRPTVRNEQLLHRYVVRCPSIDIESIGAGGGSIAWVDEGGGMRIGPKSAGADPGPVCYGKGGEEPTVTDCNLVLGHIDANRFLGGDFKLDVDAATAAIDKRLAKPLGMGVPEAAQLVRSLAVALMAQAVRLVTVERGDDPRKFVFIPYGGAGPLHSVDIARELEIPTIVVPPMPALFSAYGMLVADMIHDVQAPILKNTDEIELNNLKSTFDALEQQVLADMKDAGLDGKFVRLERFADCRYLAQAESLMIPVPDGSLGDDWIERLANDFSLEHERRWGFVQPERAITVVNLRVHGVGELEDKREAPKKAASDSSAAVSDGERHVYIDGEMRTLPRFVRGDLEPGQTVNGPAVIEEANSSIAIYRGNKAVADSFGNLVIHL